MQYKAFIIYAKKKPEGLARWYRWNNSLHFYEGISEGPAEDASGSYLAQCPAMRKDIGIMNKMQDPGRATQMRTYIERCHCLLLPPGSDLMIAFSNGTLNVKTMRLHSHFPPFDSPKGGWRITLPKALVGVSSKYKSGPPPWQVLEFFFFLGSYDPIRINLIRHELARIFLYDLRLQIGLYLTGASNAGKSTLYDWLLRVFGGSVVVMRFANLSNNFHIHRCATARLIMFDEVVQVKSQNIENFRQFIASGALVSEIKHGTIQNVEVNAHVLVAGNVQAILPADGGPEQAGTARRLLIVPTDFSKRGNEVYTDMLDLLYDNVGPIINWVRGISEELTVKGHAEPISRFLSAIYQPDGTLLEDWLVQTCRIHPEGRTLLGFHDTKGLYPSWVSYFGQSKDKKSAKPMNDKEFGKALRQTINRYGLPYNTKRMTGGYTAAIGIVQKEDRLWSVGQPIKMEKTEVLRVFGDYL